MLDKPVDCSAIVVVGLLTAVQCGCAALQSTPAAMGPPAGGSRVAQAKTDYTLDTPIEVIAANPGGAAVLNKDIPGLLANANYAAFKGMNLRSLASMSGGRLSQEKLAQTQADLAALRKGDSEDR